MTLINPDQLIATSATLSDRFNRQFSYLRLSVTDVCNFRCNYCLPDGYQCQDKIAPLSLDEIHQLVSLMAAKGIRKVRITGGEPTVRKDLTDIIRTVKNIDGIEKVVLTTNGYKLKQLLPDWIEAGLDGLNVSVDSLDPDMFQAITGHNRLQDTLEGLDLALALGMTSVKVNAVLMRSYNAREFRHFLNWIRHKPISLRFIELMETGDNHEFFKQNHVRGQTLLERLHATGWQSKKREAHAGPALELVHPDYAGSVGLIMPYSKDFCQSCNRLRISAKGKLHLCLFGEQGYDLRPWLTGEANDQLELSQYIDQCLGLKNHGHRLDEHQSGSTRHLAMLGG